ncbi:MAG: hypothetical protein AAFU85_32615 [Planctomycetota bacterium]
MKLLRHPPTNHETTAYKVAIVTGLSNPRSTDLSPAQHQFLDALPVPDTCKVRCNFPFFPTPKPQHDPSLIRASLNNTHQFVGSLSRDYKKNAKPHWRALCDSTERLFLITGSCGYQLIDSLETRDPSRVHVLALGAVRFGTSRWDATKILGRRDWIARWFTPNCDHSIDGLGHLGYWQNPTVLGIATNWVLDNLSESSAPAATFRQDG